MDLGRITASLGGASCFTPQLCVSSSVETSDLEPDFQANALNSKHLHRLTTEGLCEIFW